jgi:xylose isomerase
MKEYFPSIPKIKYEGAASDNPLAYKFYNPEEVIAGKKMKDQLRFSAAYWHTICAAGSDCLALQQRIRPLGILIRWI